MELVDLATVAFGWAAGTSVSLEDTDVEAFDGRAVVDETFRSAWCTDPFVDHLDHFNDALALGNPSFDTVTNFDAIGRLR